MQKSKLLNSIATCLIKHNVKLSVTVLNTMANIVHAHERKTFTAEQIRKKLLKLNPQIKNKSKFTNPFLYSDIEQWYDELGKIK